MTIKIAIDEPACIGCGTCWLSNPDLFREKRVGEDLKSIATGRTVSDAARLRLIAEGCPTLSIQLIDADGTIVYPTPEQRRRRDAAADW